MPGPSTCVLGLHGSVLVGSGPPSSLCFESSLSGIHDTSMHDRVFYKRRFSIPEEWSGKRILLHFEAVDYQCRVFVNGMLCAAHTGGNIGFCADITDCLSPGSEQSLAVALYYPKKFLTFPSGKMFWV